MGANISLVVCFEVLEQLQATTTLQSLFLSVRLVLSYLTTEDGEIKQIELLHEQDDVLPFYAHASVFL